MIQAFQQFKKIPIEIVREHIFNNGTGSNALDKVDEIYMYSLWFFTYQSFKKKKGLIHIVNSKIKI